MTKAALLSLLTVQGQATFTHNNRLYTLRSIEREDGSGNKFNLYVWDIHNRACVLFIKTVD